MTEYTVLYNLLDRNNKSHVLNITPYELIDYLYTECKDVLSCLQFVKLYKSRNEKLFDQLQILLSEYKDVEVVRMYKNDSDLYYHYILFLKS